MHKVEIWRGVTDALLTDSLTYSKLCERESDKSFMILTITERRERPTKEEVIIDDAKPNNLRLVSEDICEEEPPSPSREGSRWGQIQLLTV